MNINYGGSLEQLDSRFYEGEASSAAEYFAQITENGTLTIQGPLTIVIGMPPFEGSFDDDISVDEYIDGYIKLQAGESLVIDKYMENMTDSMSVEEKLVNDSIIYGYVEHAGGREYLVINDEPSCWPLVEIREEENNIEILNDIERHVGIKDTETYVLVVHA
jgi:hypothetical protein